MDRLRAVGLTCGIGSMLVGAREAGFDVIGNVEWRTYYHGKDEQGRNTFVENFPGAFMRKKAEDLTHDDVERLMGVDLAMGHPESFRPDVPIFTSKGWVPIGDVKIGDLVLTHRGRFRRVYRTIKYKAPRDTDEVTFARNSRKSGSSLVTTGNHPMLMEDGTWRSASKVRKGEKILFLSEPCLECEKLTPVSSSGRPTCYCRVKKAWKRLSPQERRNRTSQAHKATRARVKSGEHDFMKEEVRRKGQIVQSSRSIAEATIMKALSLPGIVRQYPVGKYFVDIGFPEARIAVEVDGGKWHGTPQKIAQDKVKENHLRSLGWIVLRVNIRADRVGSKATEKTISECVSEVRRLLANHEGRYLFKAFRIGGLWRKKFKTGEALCNLGVEEDETYIANGFVVHNCGNFSTMNGTNAWRDNAPKVTDPGDIPLFTKLVAKIRPRYFVMDDLPKSFMAYSMGEYHAALPDYDLFPEWISNYNYGNVQKHRRRMFMIGALREERFAFVPGEFEHNRTVEDEIGDLPVEPPAGHRGLNREWVSGTNAANHDIHTLDEPCGRGLHMDFVGHRPSWRDMRAWMEKARIGESFRYHSTAGGIKNKPGWYKSKWDGPAPVMDGGSGHMHPIRNLPFTIRERARIQGFSDDFVFYGIRRNADGTWCHERNIGLIKQTGKAMPIQFCRYAAKLVRASIEGVALPEATGRRVIGPNDLVSAAKSWYCENVGYSDQEKACGACWLFSRCDIRSRKYGIGSPAGRPEASDARVSSGADLKQGQPLVPEEAIGEASGSDSISRPRASRRSGAVPPTEAAAPILKPGTIHPTAESAAFKKRISNL